jgi:hypothetical protein
MALAGCASQRPSVHNSEDLFDTVVELGTIDKLDLSGSTQGGVYVTNLALAEVTALGSSGYCGLKMLAPGFVMAHTKGRDGAPDREKAYHVISTLAA